MATKVLVVDDEKLIVKGIRFSLEKDGYEVDTAYDGGEALEKIQNGSYDLIILDLMLPVLSGTDVCRRVREFSDVPIIMLTAKSEDMDKILGLEYGADDYITKPFNILEVKARIKAILRRMQAAKAVAQESSVKARRSENGKGQSQTRDRGQRDQLNRQGIRASGAFGDESRKGIRACEAPAADLGKGLSR